MKKLFLFLVAALCLPLVSSADDWVYIDNVNFNGNISVTVKMTEKAKQQCESVNFKVVPTDRAFARLLNDGVKYGEIKKGNPSISVYFGCGEGAKDEASQCRLYDFEVITTNRVPKK